MLKWTSFGVDRDYPKEIAEARKELYTSEEAKDARSKRLKVQVKYPAKLFVDGRMTKNLFPDWFNNLRESRIDDFELDEDNDELAHRALNPHKVTLKDPWHKDQNKTINQSNYSAIPWLMTITQS